MKPALLRLGPQSAPPRLRQVPVRERPEPAAFPEDSGPEPGGGPSGGLSRLTAGALILSALGAVQGAQAAAPPPASASHARTLDRPAGTRRSRAELVGRLLGEPSMAGPARRAAEAQVAALPDRVLELLDRNHVRVVRLEKGQTPLTAGLTRDVEPGRDLADPAALGRRARAETRKVDQHFQARLERLARSEESGESGFLADAAETTWLARAEREDLEEDRMATARRSVQEATGGRVDLEPLYASELSPELLRDLAGRHGARTPEEVREFGDLVKALNAGGPSEGEGAGPLPAPSEALLIPAYQFVHEGGGLRRISTHDWMSHLAWREGAVQGQYFYHGDLNAVVLAPEAFEPEGLRQRVVLHELGHAFEDALREREPAQYGPLRVARDRAWEGLADQHEHPFWGQHASTSPSEFLAETFSTVYGGEARGLRTASPGWLRAFEAALPDRPGSAD